MPNNKFQKVFSGADQIATGFTVEAPHVSQSYDAFNFSNSTVAYDIDIGGDLEAAGQIKYTGLATGGAVGYVTVNSTGVLASAAAATSGTDGTNGTNGTDGADGNNGADGADGIDGVNGTNGTSGTNGTDGTSGTSIIVADGANNRVTTAVDEDNIQGETNLTYVDTTGLVITPNDGISGLTIVGNKTTAYTNNNLINRILFQANGGSGTDSIGRIDVTAAGNTTSTITPNNIEFYTGGSSVNKVLELSGSKEIIIPGYDASLDTFVLPGREGGATFQEPEHYFLGVDTNSRIKKVQGGRSVHQKYDYGSVDIGAFGAGNYIFEMSSSYATNYEGSFSNGGTVDNNMIIRIHDDITGSYSSGDEFMFGTRFFGSGGAGVSLQYRYVFGGTIKNTDINTNVINGEIVWAFFKYVKRDVDDYGLVLSHTHHWTA